MIRPMALKLRPTGLGHGVYKDNPDYGVFCGEWCIGRIYETRTGPADLRWFWALHAPQAAKPAHLQPGGDAGPSQGRVRGELEAVEGVGGGGGDIVGMTENRVSAITIQQIEFELEKAERGMAMPYDAERVMQLRHMLREVRKQKLSAGFKVETGKGSAMTTRCGPRPTPGHPRGPQCLMSNRRAAYARCESSLRRVGLS